MTRTHRERLVKNGFIKEVMKGWYIPARPEEPAGESTAWYASFWGFCADYLKSRFGNQWCLSPEQSLSIHSGNWNVPAQLLVRAPKGGNKPISLPYPDISQTRCPHASPIRRLKPFSNFSQDFGCPKCPILKSDKHSLRHRHCC